MVLVRGGLERLGEVVRCVRRLSPDADVLLRADQLASLPPGSTVVLPLRREDFDWLNIGRPVVLGHRVILFGDAETALALERRSFDFFDWISHRIDAPPGPPRFAVEGIRNAACKRAWAVVWRGGEQGLEEAFAEALPGRVLSRVSAEQPYVDLVAALKPRARAWVVVTGLATEFRVQRVPWALAEAGRYGGTILMDPAEGVGELPIIDAGPVALEVAAERLSEAGVEHAARLAALLDLEPGAIEWAGKLARAGVGEDEIERRIGEVADARIPRRETAQRRLPGWAERVDLASRRGDVEVVMHWATSWRAAEPDSARATATLATVLLDQGSYDHALLLLGEAIAQAGPTPDAETSFEIAGATALLRAWEGDPDGAAAATDEAIRLFRRMDRPIAKLDELYLSRVQALANARRLSEAERVIADWSALPRPAGADDTAKSLAIARLRAERGDPKGALDILRRALTHIRHRESVGWDALVHMLAHVLLDQRAFEEAERLTRTAIANAEKRGRMALFLRNDHARASLGLGRFDAAERELRDVLASRPRGPDAAVARVMLARSLVEQGRLEEAEVVVDEAISDARRAREQKAGVLPALLYQKAHLLRLKGNDREALLILRELLREEERTSGRDSVRLVPLLNAIGDSLIQSQEPASAQPLLRRAQRIAERASDSVGLAQALGHLAFAESAQGFPQAAHTARRALEAWSRAGREPAPDVRNALEIIASGGLPEQL